MVMTEDEKKLTAYHEAGHASSRCNVPEPTRSTRRRSSRAAARWAGEITRDDGTKIKPSPIPVVGSSIPRSGRKGRGGLGGAAAAGA
jgi:hypothetical protein